MGIWSSSPKNPEEQNNEQVDDSYSQSSIKEEKNESKTNKSNLFQSIKNSFSKRNTSNSSNDSSSSSTNIPLYKESNSTLNQNKNPTKTCITESKIEKENKYIKKRIEMINKIYSINEENVEQISNELITFIKTSTPNQEKYWIHVILHSFFIRPKSIKHSLFLLKKVNIAFSQKDFLLSNPENIRNFQLYLYAGKILDEEEFLNKFYYTPNKLQLINHIFTQYPRNSLKYYLKYDLIDEYTKYMHSSNESFTKSLNVSENISILYLINNTQVSLNQFCAFYGSIKCYKFSKINGSNRQDLLYSLASGNTDIINTAVYSDPDSIKNNLFTTSIKFHQLQSYESLVINFDLDPKYSCKFIDIINCYNEKFFFLYSEYALEDSEYKKNVDYGGSLIAATKIGSIEIMKYILDQKLESSILKKSNNPTSELYQTHQTILQKACIDNNINLIENLISHGADVNYSYNDRITALHYASGYSYEGTKLLIKAKANINARTTTGITPLHIACALKRFSTIQFLVDNGADINAITTVHFSPYF